jgi:hypothetical protein
VIEVLHSASVTSTTALLSSSTANILQNCQSSGPQHHSAGTLKHPLGGMSSRFGKLCIKVALFRAGDGLYLSCVVPFLLQGDRCLHYGDNLYVRLTIFTFFTTAILFTAETITLNRLSLVFKAPQVGFWSKLKRRRSFLAASHSLFATEVAHARASEGLLVCSAALSGLLASQTLLVLVSLHWVPYACLIIGTFTSSLLVNCLV